MEYLILWNLWRNEVCNLFISKERCTIMTYYKNILQKCWRGISNLNNKIYAVVHKNSMIFLLVKYVQRARYRSIVKTLDISHKIVLNHLKKIRFARKIYILVIWVFWINSIDRIIIREMLLKHNEMEIFQKQPKKQQNIFFLICIIKSRIQFWKAWCSYFIDYSTCTPSFLTLYWIFAVSNEKRITYEFLTHLSIKTCF